MKKILITGGLGYIGSSLVEKLMSQPESTEIVVYDNLSRNNYNLLTQSHARGKFEFIHGNLLDSRKLKNALKDVTTVVHLAAQVSTPFSDVSSSLFEQSNHWGTAELCSAIESSSSVTQLVFVSSTAIYGGSDQEQDYSKEPNPSSFYALSKLRAEEQLKRLPSRVESVVFRSANVFGVGPSIRFDAVLNKFCLDAIYSKKLQIHGSGEQRRGFIEISQVTKALEDAINGLVSPGTYDLVQGNYSIAECAEAINSVFKDIECIQVNQNYKYPSVVVRRDDRINIAELDLKSSIEKMKAFLLNSKS